jgi:hypothetical protein
LIFTKPLKPYTRQDALDFLFSDDCNSEWAIREMTFEGVIQFNLKIRNPCLVSTIPGVYAGYGVENFLWHNFGAANVSSYESFDRSMDDMMKEWDTYSFHSRYGWTDDMEYFVNREDVAKYLNQPDRYFIVGYTTHDINKSDIYHRGKNGYYHGSEKGRDNDILHMFHIYEVFTPCPKENRTSGMIEG